VWTPEKLHAAIAMYRAGEHDVATIARVLGVSRATVYRGLAAAEADNAPDRGSRA
jgi:transposase-like protein